MNISDNVSRIGETMKSPQENLDPVHALFRVEEVLAPKIWMPKPARLPGGPEYRDVPRTHGNSCTLLVRCNSASHASPKKAKITQMPKA